MNNLTKYMLLTATMALVFALPAHAAAIPITTTFDKTITKADEYIIQTPSPPKETGGHQGAGHQSHCTYKMGMVNGQITPTAVMCEKTKSKTFWELHPFLME